MNELKEELQTHHDHVKSDRELLEENNEMMKEILNLQHAKRSQPKSRGN